MAGGTGPRSVTRVSGGKRSGPYTVGRSSSHVSAVGVSKRSPGQGTGPRTASRRSGGSNSGPCAGGGGYPKLTGKAMGKSGGGVNLGGKSGNSMRPPMSPKGRLRSTEEE